MSRFEQLIKDKKLMSGIYTITLVTSLLVLALVIKGPEKSGELIAGDDGRVTGISRRSTDRSEHYDLRIEVRDSDAVVERDVELVLQAKAGGEKTAGISSADDREAAIDSAIDTLISEVEYSKEKHIVLPEKLPDGTAVTWKSRERENVSSMMLLIPALYISLVALMIGSRIKGDGKKDEERRVIMRGLPRFCNQLFLMMNAGLILSDAFDTITGSYSMYRKDKLSSFENDLSGLRDATDGHRVSTAFVISEYAVKHDVKELIRIAAILTENEKRGSDVVESLARESRYLWDERKTVARESGKMIDTKMSYPLGLLLVLLIIITMAPALLNI